jgi:hypothetical protein
VAVTESAAGLPAPCRRLPQPRIDPLPRPRNRNIGANVLPLGCPGPDMRFGQIDLIMIGDSHHTIQNVGQLVRDTITASLVGKIAVSVLKVVTLGRQQSPGQVPDLFCQFYHHGLQAPRPTLSGVKCRYHLTVDLCKLMDGIGHPAIIAEGVDVACQSTDSDGATEARRKPVRSQPVSGCGRSTRCKALKVQSVSSADILASFGQH